MSERASYLTVGQTFNLKVACRAIEAMGYGVFHVGSSLDRPDYRDVDLRCILSDEQFDAMFEGNMRRLSLFNTALSEWLGTRSGLPIDFQFQRMTDANLEFKGRYRNAVFDHYCDAELQRKGEA